ncbi:RNase adapter RapZ [Candidatus Babeliales bacterium]|nr:RNase adapter RapZ [Candidatus Babeliales bacterium]
MFSIMVVNNLEQTLDSQVLIVTGLSGAGKNVVLNALEDLGFYCVNNLPVPLVSTFLKFAFQANGGAVKVALGIDIRAKKYIRDFMQEVEQLKLFGKGEYFFKVIFLNSSDETLIKRYQETRRAHPLAKDLSVLEAIRTEKVLLDPIKQLADIILDTDSFNIHELRKWARETFADSNQKMIVNLISFGFKYGVPIESNIVCDVRFLPNPYFIPALKALDGREKEIQEYLFKQKEVVDYWERIKDFVYYSIQKCYQEGRPFVNVAIGCTGGRHRSVSFVEKLGQSQLDNTVLLVHHRDVNK